MATRLVLASSEFRSPESPVAVHGLGHRLFLLERDKRDDSDLAAAMGDLERIQHMAAGAMRLLDTGR